MATRTWRLDLDGQTHTVELEHGVLSGKRNLWVDGQAVTQTRKFLHMVFDLGSRYPFYIGQHQCLASVRLRAFGLMGFRYELTVDGQPVAYLPVRPQPSGCLVTWLAVVVLVNAGTILSYLVRLLSSDTLGMDSAPWMGLIYVCFALVSLTYVGLSLAALRLGKWAILGLYGLSVVTMPLNAISYWGMLGSLFGPLEPNSLLRTVLVVAVILSLSIVSWLLGVLGIVISVSLMQDSGYLSE